MNGDESLDQDMGDPFTLVTYKKNRPQGIPVLFKPVDSGKSFWKVNPNVVAKTIRSAAQESILRHRVNADGSMCVFVQTEGAVSNLMTLSEVAGVAVTVTIPSSYVNNMGKIYDVPLEYTDEELTSYLGEDGVIAAWRQVRHVSHEDGSDQYTPLRNVILTFKSNRRIPEEVKFGFSTHKVHEYVESPVQCYHCQRFGHLARSCRWPLRCKFCSQPHTLKECTARRQPECANCEGPHAASHSLCPRKRAATRRFQARVLTNTPSPGFRKARRSAQTDGGSTLGLQAAKSDGRPQTTARSQRAPQQVSKPTVKTPNHKHLSLNRVGMCGC
ncbi:uncharacterized protein LOC135370905 [Ornithodoros turicata]|uniref:uncharacterized protein LOC135370905 n=1 Tax=Ornithodoros turicata TaxID=34597 RepID=UPI003138C267